jgi:hypothetical protein
LLKAVTLRLEVELEEQIRALELALEVVQVLCGHMQIIL